METKKRYYKPVERINGHTRNFGRKFSEEARKKMSDSQKKRFEDPVERELVRERVVKYWSDPDNRKLISERQKQRYNTPELIKKREEKQKERMAGHKLNKKTGKRNPVKRTPEQIQKMRELKYKTVHQYTMDGEYIQSFRSTADALESLGKARTNCTISNHLNGRHGSAFGYKWSFIKAKRYTSPVPKEPPFIRVRRRRRSKAEIEVNAHEVLTVTNE
ncbi:MAG: hypothetical protein WC333_00045 [Dehalococcoidia bacterium]|jgi:hypothetical protein